MRTMVWLSAMVAVCVAGCASVTQRATTTETTMATNGPQVIVERETTAKLRTLFDSKQSVEKLRASNGKTQSLGATGVENEATTAGLQNMWAGLLALAQVMGPMAVGAPPGRATLALPAASGLAAGASLPAAPVVDGAAGFNTNMVFKVLPDGTVYACYPGGLCYLLATNQVHWMSNSVAR
jgi:hypothetical protein